MKDEDKTKEQLVNELEALRRRVAELEAFERAHLRVEDELLKFSHAVAQSPSAIIITDTAGNIQYVNPKFTEISGYSFEEVLGKNPRILKSGETPAEEYVRLWNTITSGGEWHGEFHNRRKNGELFWEYASISPIRNFEGVISHFVGIKEDITERKRAEGAIGEAKLYTDNIIRSMANALIVINPNASIRTVNTAACELLEYTENELTGQSINGIFLDEKSFINRLLKLIEDGFVKDHETCFKTKTGQKIPVCLNGTVMYSHEGGLKKTIGIIFVARDIREMKRMQKQLIQSEKMASLGTLAAGVAHEIKNPLAIILQGMEYLISTLQFDQSLLDVAGRIKKAVLRADRIVKGLLNFSRQTPFKFEESDIKSVIDEALSFVEGLIRAKNIKIVRQFAPSLPAVMLDSNQMKQVFTNILANSADAMTEGGVVTIGLEQDNTQNGREMLRITFEDNGCGISEKDIQNVFDPFFSTKQKDGNAGLGLSIIKGIIEGHSGTINVESVPGTGTKVIIRLPFFNS